eukprot:1428397-Alexandrium_andersonii.AAC.1
MRARCVQSSQPGRAENFGRRQRTCAKCAARARCDVLRVRCLDALMFRAHLHWNVNQRFNRKRGPL